MDTLAALDLAANIIQFLHVATSFIEKARAFYVAGNSALGEVQDLVLISKDFQAIPDVMSLQSVD